MARDLIDSAEMYLRTVLELEEEGIPALRARLSERLGLSAPSVSEAVARLGADGLVRLTADRTVALTEAGRDKALHVMRKHRLAERLLVDVLGLEPEHAHDEACRWEHVISDRVEEKLEAFLGNPSTSPYGNPIPDLHAPRRTTSLTAIAELAGGQATIERFSEQVQGDEDLMTRLEQAGVRAGASVEVAAQDTGLVLRTGEGEVSVDEDAARHIYVTTK